MNLKHRINRDFSTRLSDTFKQPKKMANITSIAGMKQIFHVIAMLELETAFGEVHHNMVPLVRNSTLDLRSFLQFPHFNCNLYLSDSVS